MIILQRDQVLGAIGELVSRNGKLAQIYFIGSIIAVFCGKTSFWIFVQMALSIALFTFLLWAWRHVRTNRIFNVRGVRLGNDIMSLIFSAFIVGYYVIYGVFALLREFHWWSLLFAVVSFAIPFALLKNAIGINIILHNLSQFGLDDEANSPDDWTDFLAKHEIRQ